MAAPQGIGETHTQFFTVATAEKPFVFDGGGSLTEAVIAYETYGTLNAKKDNAVLVFHALSGSQHAAGFTAEVPGTDGRWTVDCHLAAKNFVTYRTLSSFLYCIPDKSYVGTS